MNGPRSIKRNEATDPVAAAKRDRADADAAKEAVADGLREAIIETAAGKGINADALGDRLIVMVI